MYYSNSKHLISCQAIYPEAGNTVALKSVKLLIFALPLGPIWINGFIMQDTQTTFHLGQVSKVFTKAKRQDRY